MEEVEEAHSNNYPPSGDLDCSPVSSITTVPNTIDKLTLEIMCNKKKYNKILSKTDPKKFEEQREHLTKIRKYSSKILSLTERLMGSPDTQITNDIQDTFDIYIKACIRYYEMKEYENKHCLEGNKDSDEDVLFGHMDESEEESDTLENNAKSSEDRRYKHADGIGRVNSEDEDSNVEKYEEPLYTSFWGKSVKKLYPPKSK